MAESAVGIMEEEINTLLSKGAIGVVPPQERQAGWYSRYFVVPKRNGSLRPILDLRVLNGYLRIFRFRMLTARQFLNSVSLGMWFTSIDLTDAFQHIAIHATHRKFLRFAFGGTAYECLILPFDLALSPRCFTKTLEAALTPLRAQGIRILAYLDDMAIVCHSKEQAVRHTATVLAHIQALGFAVNYLKQFQASVLNS